MGNSIEEADQVITNVMQLQYPRNVWEYNQIVGFVEIFIIPRILFLIFKKHWILGFGQLVKRNIIFKI